MSGNKLVLEPNNPDRMQATSSKGDAKAERALNVAAAAPLPGEGCVVIVRKDAV